MIFGNVKAFIHALAALYLLNLYYRNDSWITAQQDISKIDYSMGSSIFTVKAPTANQLLYGNNPTISESPYVAAYQDTDYQRIEKMQQEEEQALKAYLEQQPELNEPAFQNQLKEAQKQREKIMIFWELAKYRLHKKYQILDSVVNKQGVK